MGPGRGGPFCSHIGLVNLPHCANALPTLIVAMARAEQLTLGLDPILHLIAANLPAPRVNLIRAPCDVLSRWRLGFAVWFRGFGFCFGSPRTGRQGLCFGRPGFRRHGCFGLRSSLSLRFRLHYFSWFIPVTGQLL